MALVAFVKAETLKVVRDGSLVWLSNEDGYPLNLRTGEVERVRTDAAARRAEGQRYAKAR